MTLYEKDTNSCYLQRRKFAVCITKFIETNDTKLLLNNGITTYTFALVYNTSTVERVGGGGGGGGGGGRYVA